MLERADGDSNFSPSELYHENSKLHPSDRLTYVMIEVVNTSPEIRSVITSPFVHYPGCPVVELPRDFVSSGRELESIMLERRSCRQFSGEGIDLRTLAKLLLLGDGIVATIPTDEGSVWRWRTAPSGGGLFPIDTYCIALRVNGLKQGLYFYNAFEHNLELLECRDLTAMLQSTTGLSAAVERAAACLILTAFMPRISFKYGERGYRFALLEAGHIAQNLLLVAQTEGLGGVPVGGFTDDAFNDLLRLDGCQEITLYLILIGARDAP